MECGPWSSSDVSDVDDANEGIEEYLSDLIYKEYIYNSDFKRTFSPYKSDDVEKDHILKQRIQLFKWIKEKHLDIPENDFNKYYYFYAGQGI